MEELTVLDTFHIGLQAQVVELGEQGDHVFF